MSKGKILKLIAGNIFNMTKFNSIVLKGEDVYHELKRGVSGAEPNQ